MRLLVLLCLLAACSGGKSASELAAESRKLAASADPAVTAALEDPIMTDPDLSVQDHSRRVRLVTGPAQATYPPRSRNNARVFAALDAIAPRRGGCDQGFVYEKDWATRLPPAFPPYPGARVVEAAGNDGIGCRMRMAAFATPASPETILAWYAARAARAGYGAERRPRGTDHILAGLRAGDGARVYLVVSGGAGGSSEVALLTQGGG